MTRQDNGKKRQYNTNHVNTMQDNTRQDNTRQHKAIHDNTDTIRQDNPI